jgi:hypothetical protein
MSSSIDINKPVIGVPITPPAPAPSAPSLPSNIFNSPTAIKIAAILNEYDKNIIRDAAQIRTYVTNKLIELSNSGNPRDELRALELLGKVSDVGLFVEKSEIQIKHTSSDSLEQIIKDKINRILGRENVEIEDAIYEEELEEESDEEDEEVIDNSDTDDE